MPDLRNPQPATNKPKDIELKKLNDTQYEVRMVLPLSDLKKVRDGLAKYLNSFVFPKDLKPFCGKLLPILEQELPK